MWCYHLVSHLLITLIVIGGSPAKAALNSAPRSNGRGLSSSYDRDALWYREGRLMSALIHRPYLKIRPTTNATSPVRIGHRLSLVAITQCEPSGYGGELVEFVAQVRQTWTDDRLTWSSRDAKGVTSIHLRAADIWTPETQVFPSLNGHQSSPSLDRYDVTVTHEGEVTWTYHATYRVPCTTGGESHVTCALRVWTPNTQATQLAMAPLDDAIDLSDYVTAGNFPVSDSRAEAELLARMDESEFYSVVRYFFSFPHRF